MRAAEIEVGAKYRVRRWSKSVRGCLIWSVSGHPHGRTRPFPAYWSYWTVTVMKKVNRRYVVEWIEPHPLHKIPDRQMKWTTRIMRCTVTASQVMEKTDD